MKAQADCREGEKRRGLAEQQCLTSFLVSLGVEQPRSRAGLAILLPVPFPAGYRSLGQVEARAIAGPDRQAPTHQQHKRHGMVHRTLPSTVIYGT